MPNLTKTYKFVYFTNYDRYASFDKKARTEYTFGNRMPEGFNSKYNVYEFFQFNDDFTTRKYFQNTKPRKIEREDFLPKNLPANEAEITLAFVKLFTYRLNRNRRKLTYLNKDSVRAKTDKVNYPHGFNPMNYNVFNPDYYRVQIKHDKANLAIWKARYEELKNCGVYTYLELMK